MAGNAFSPFVSLGYLILYHYHSCFFASSRSVTPKIAPFSFGDDPANFGEPASVQCSVVLGDFPIDIVWLLDGQPLDPDRVATAKLGKRLSVLNIDAVSAEHAGNYTCSASNLAGAYEHTSALRVNGKIYARSFFVYNILEWGKVSGCTSFVRFWEASN